MARIPSQAPCLPLNKRQTSLMKAFRLSTAISAVTVASPLCAPTTVMAQENNSAIDGSSGFRVH